jgi:hypothetical protein
MKHTFKPRLNHFDVRRHLCNLLCLKDALRVFLDLLNQCCILQASVIYVRLRTDKLKIFYIIYLR